MILLNNFKLIKITLKISKFYYVIYNSIDFSKTTTTLNSQNNSKVTKITLKY